MYTEQNVVKVWKALFPSITKLEDAIQVSLNGRTVRLEITKASSEVTDRHYRQYG